MISATGVECACIPTALLSTHTGEFTGWTLHDLSDDMLPIARHWKSTGAEFDGVYTGYLATPHQVHTLEPVIDVIWDNTDVRNGKYYNRPRRAVIRITDLSFDPRGVKILPYQGGFRETGASAYETEVSYDEDGEWKLNCACTDLAGNAAVPVDESAFVIDTEPPRMYFDKDTVQERGAYGGEICPQLRWEEENPSDAACCAVWNNLTSGGQA